MVNLDLPNYQRKKKTTTTRKLSQVNRDLPKYQRTKENLCKNLHKKEIVVGKLTFQSIRSRRKTCNKDTAICKPWPSKTSEDEEK